ncbi:MAG: hypothetical protein HQL48_05775 [Gammaproteobacteria bacterium]|nr:hypothetical protein [Gammaproteobacteria bacterium]
MNNLFFDGREPHPDEVEAMFEEGGEDLMRRLMHMMEELEKGGRRR